MAADTWAALIDCHDNFAADDSTPAVITVTSAGVMSMDTQFVITKHVWIVPSGTVEIKDDAFSGLVDGGDAESTIVIHENANGAVHFGGDGHGSNTFLWNHTGDTTHANPAAVIFMYPEPDGVPIVLKGMKSLGPPPNGFIGALIHAPNRGVITGFNMVGHISDSGPCQNNQSFIRMAAADVAGSWTSASNFGDADADGTQSLFVEGNTLNRFNEMIDVKESGRLVFRYNTVINSGFIHHGSDTEPWAARSSEIYGNEFIRDNILICTMTGYVGEGTGSQDMNGQGFISIHGGTSRIHNNIIPCYDTAAWGNECGETPNKAAMSYEQWNLHRAATPGVTDYGCWGTAANSQGYTGMPIPSQAGWGWTTGAVPAGNTSRDMDLEPIYVFANTGTAPSYINTSVSNFSPDGCMGLQMDSAEDYVRKDVEYYEQEGTAQSDDDTPFDGTTGTGFGTHANRPSTCTSGTAYWETDTGPNWKLKNLDGSDNEDSSDGQLFICAGDAWPMTADYIPFEFPHPLIENSQPGETGGNGNPKLRLFVRP